VVLHPDAAPFADNRFDCCDLRQRSHHSSWDRQGLRHKLNVIMQNRSTPEYWFEKAYQCFRRSQTDSNLRVELESLGNAFMVKAVELDVKLQNLAVGNYTAALLVRA